MNLADYYADAYANPGYRMKRDRQWNLADYLSGTHPSATAAKDGHLPAFLDVGCGRGESLTVADACGYEAAGCEIVPELCGPAVRLIHPGEPLPYLDENFDVVASIDVLEHIPEQSITRALQELFRITAHRLYLGICTRPGRGHLLVQDAELWEASISLACLSEPRRLTPKHRIENYVYLEVSRDQPQ